MRAQFFVGLVVRAFPEQVKVEFRKNGREAIGVFELVPPAIIRAQAIGKQRLLTGEDRFEKTVRMDAPQRHDLAAVRTAHHPSVMYARQESANRHRRFPLPLHQMHPQNVEGVTMLSAQDLRDFVHRRRCLS